MGDIRKGVTFAEGMHFVPRDMNRHLDDAELDPACIGGKPSKATGALSDEVLMSDGELKRVSMRGVIKSARIGSKQTDTSNSGANETTLWSQTVPGSTLDDDGDGLGFEAIIQTSAGTSQKRIRVKFGGVTLFDWQSAFDDEDIHLRGEIVRASATSIRSMISGTRGAGTTQPMYLTGTVTLSNNQDFLITGTGTTSNTITLSVAKLRVLPY